MVLNVMMRQVIINSEQQNNTESPRGPPNFPNPNNLGQCLAGESREGFFELLFWNACDEVDFFAFQSDILSDVAQGVCILVVGLPAFAIVPLDEGVGFGKIEFQCWAVPLERGVLEV